MPVTEILLLRHGHRLAWTLDPTTGRYSSSHPYPTRLPADPPLAAHGVRQARETGSHLSSTLADLATQDRLRIYSSLFYRCLETLRPTVEKLREGIRARASGTEQDHLLRSLEVRGERGIGEWFGRAWFEQPAPADATRLKKDFFPWIDVEYQSRLTPDPHGEKIEGLHDRVAEALAAVVKHVDAEYQAAGRDEDEVTLLFCGHAAQIICTGRALTGEMPEDHDDEDFKCYTCGISKFIRRRTSSSSEDDINWRTCGGVAGGWDCAVNCDCSHLSQGEERGWHFHGDESFDSYGPTAGVPIISGGGLKSPVRRIDDTNEISSKL